MIFEINNGSVKFIEPLLPNQTRDITKDWSEEEAVEQIVDKAFEADIQNARDAIGDNWGADEAEILLDDDIYFAD